MDHILAMDSETEVGLGKCLGGKATALKVLVLDEGLPQSDRIYRSINERVDSDQELSHIYGLAGVAGG